MQKAKAFFQIALILVAICLNLTGVLADDNASRGIWFSPPRRSAVGAKGSDCAPRPFADRHGDLERSEISRLSRRFTKAILTVQM